MTSWDKLSALSEDAFRPIAQRIIEDLNEGRNVYPAITSWLRAFDLTPFDEVKVVILGQDPYPTAGHATGLAFSVHPDTALPQSLRNIFRELNEDVGVVRTNGDLTDWARQGVLLLNTALTVVEGKPGSHSNIGWEDLAKEAIQKLNNERENIVFVLWGKKAQAFEHLIDSKHHCVIKSPHPSPLSARRGFFGSKPFSQINDYLTKHNIKPIQWREK